MILDESFRKQSRNGREGKEGSQPEVGIYRLCLSCKNKWFQDPETFKSKQVIRKRNMSVEQVGREQEPVLVGVVLRCS